MKIVSVKKIGKKQTYSISMKNEPHNYILKNGAVSKNSHSFSYGYIAYQTAWLKANYPTEYMCALMTNANKAEQRSVFLHECREMGLEVVVPDINKSHVGFYPDGQKILFGIGSVRNVGEGPAELIVKGREGGEYTSIYDFLERVDVSVLNKRVLEALIQAGGLDSFGHSRHGMMSILDKLLPALIKRRKNEEVGQFDLFSSAPAEKDEQIYMKIPTSEFDGRKKLALEKEMLGFYISDNPIDELAQRAIKKRSSISIASLIGDEDNKIEQCTIGGIITGLEIRMTKKGDQMATFTLEDSEASVPVVLFPKQFRQFGKELKEDAIVLISGRPDYEAESFKLIAREISQLENESEKITEIHLKISENSEILAKLPHIVKNNKGNSSIYLHIGNKTYDLGKKHTVKCSYEFLTDMELLFKDS